MAAPGAAATRDRDGTTGGVRAYWNARIHDAQITGEPVGSAAFFADLEAYRFAKLDYLPAAVAFDGYPGRAVLEIGCGIGIDLARFAAGGARVTGVDLSDTAIALARRHLAARRLDGSLLVADGARLPFGDASFDLVYCHGVVPYAPDPAGIAREAHRVLRAGGDAIFMAYNQRSWLAWLWRASGVALEHSDAPVFQLHTRAELHKLLAAFAARRVTTERFPVPSRLHRGFKGTIFNAVLVPAARALPRRWVRGWGWHLMAFCRKAG